MKKKFKDKFEYRFQLDSNNFIAVNFIAVALGLRLVVNYSEADKNLNKLALIVIILLQVFAKQIHLST